MEAAASGEAQRGGRGCVGGARTVARGTEAGCPGGAAERPFSFARTQHPGARPGEPGSQGMFTPRVASKS